LKIALVILHADPARGGAERYTVDAAAALARRGHEVAILASDFAEPIDGVRFIQLAAGGGTKRGQFNRYLDSLDSHLWENTYDIVHAMMPVRQCDLYHPHAGLAAEQMEKLHSHFNPRRRLFAEVEKKLLGSGRVGTAHRTSHGVGSAHPTVCEPIVVCLSDYVKRTVLKYFELPEQRLATLFNAVDLERFDPGEPLREPGKIRALMVAQDFERKGVRQAIEAIAGATNDRVSLTVLGRDNAAPYQRLAERLNVADRVRFAGAVPDPRPEYRAADFFVLPTRHDPCSLATLEAMAMGLPVISTTFNGACEVMRDGIHGYVLPDPQDVQALTAAIGRLCDAGNRTPMRKACLALRPTLSYESHIDRLLEIYQLRISSR
jgi:UDP-glucose:(heptosyl)LPS alpha-1,3-glucosyltransferase